MSHFSRPFLATLLISLISTSSIVFADQPRPIVDPAVEACKAATHGVKVIKAQVLRGVDGDTVKVRLQNNFQTSIRMLTIDTPETHYEGKTQGHWGDVAAASLADMLKAGMVVDVVLDNEPCDGYGRILGYVEYQRADANLAQIQRGLAFPYCIAPNWTRCVTYAVEAEKARIARRGAWSDTTLDLPYEWRRKISGRPHEKYIGDLETKLVYAPGSLDKVQVNKRIFFMKKAAIVPPFRLAPGQQ